jgi:hypothetical protein
MHDIPAWTKRAAIPALLALLLAGAAARADDGETIDQALRKQAPKVLKYLEAQKVKNVGVLKFLAGRGGQTRDDLGALNRTLADRLEVALVLAMTDDEEDRLSVLTRASDVVADAGDPKLTHLTADGREAFFPAEHPLRFARAWGKAEPVAADAFLTGDAVVANDWRSVKVRIRIFDKKSPRAELKTVVDWFTAASDPRTLTECGVSYAHKKGAKDDEDDTPKKELDNLAINISPSLPGAPPAPPEKEKERERDWDELLTNSPVKVDILYNDKPVTIKAGAVETPKADDTVTFRLKNTDKNATYGVVLKVNGENTIEHQKLPALDCYKWVLEPGVEIVVDGFQKGNEKAQQFKVLPPEASKGDEINYGDNAGVFSLVVFRAAAKEEDAFVRNEEKRNQEVKAISRGSLISKVDQPPRSLKALQDELTAEADPTRSHEGQKGLIVAGKLSDSKIEHKDFTPYPREELSLVVRYYKPKK